MACPTCDHTMHNLGVTPNQRVFWCPRCGTLKDEGNPPRDVPDVAVPFWIRGVENSKDHIRGMSEEREKELQDGIRSRKDGWGRT